ncbi:MAG: hypothetical protein ACJ76F_03575 [Bacteroidia bacterium]
MSDLFGTYTWLVVLVSALLLFIFLKILFTWYWKNQTLPSNKLLFSKYFTLTYNDVFNDLSCVKTDWRNIYRIRDFSRKVIDLKDKEKIRFKGAFTSMKFNSLVNSSRSMQRLLLENAALLNGGTGMQDNTIIRFYQEHKDQFEKYDDAFSSFLKNVTDVPKPVKEEAW